MPTTNEWSTHIGASLSSADDVVYLHDLLRRRCGVQFQFIESSQKAHTDAVPLSPHNFVHLLTHTNRNRSHSRVRFHHNLSLSLFPLSGRSSVVRFCWWISSAAAVIVVVVTSQFFFSHFQCLLVAHASVIVCFAFDFEFNLMVFSLSLLLSLPLANRLISAFLRVPQKSKNYGNSIFGWRIWSLQFSSLLLLLYDLP